MSLCKPASLVERVQFGVSEPPPVGVLKGQLRGAVIRGASAVQYPATYLFQRLHEA